VVAKLESSWWTKVESSTEKKRGERKWRRRQKLRKQIERQSRCRKVHVANDGDRPKREERECGSPPTKSASSSKSSGIAAALKMQKPRADTANMVTETLVADKIPRSIRLDESPTLEKTSVRKKSLLCHRSLQRHATHSTSKRMSKRDMKRIRKHIRGYSVSPPREPASVLSASPSNILSNNEECSSSMDDSSTDDSEKVSGAECEEKAIESRRERARNPRHCSKAKKGNMSKKERRKLRKERKRLKKMKKFEKWKIRRKERSISEESFASTGSAGDDGSYDDDDGGGSSSKGATETAKAEGTASNDDDDDHHHHAHSRELRLVVLRSDPFVRKFSERRQTPPSSPLQGRKLSEKVDSPRRGRNSGLMRSRLGHMYAVSSKNGDAEVFSCCLMQHHAPERHCMFVEKQRWVKGASRAVALAVVNKRIVVAFRDIVHVWDKFTGVHLLAERRHKSPISILNTDESTRNIEVISADEGGLAMVWNPATGHASWSRTCGDAITCAQLRSPLVAVGTATGGVHVWDTTCRRGEAVCANAKVHKGRVSCLTVAEQQTGEYMVASGGDDGNINVWLLISSEKDSVVPRRSRFEKVYSRQLRGHTAPIVLLAVDSYKVFSSSKDGTHKMWQAAGNHIGRCMCTLNETTYHGKVSVARLGATFVALGHDDGLISFFRWGSRAKTEHGVALQKRTSGKKKKAKMRRVKSARTSNPIRRAGSNRRWLRDMKARCNDDYYGLDDF